MFFRAIDFHPHAGTAGYSQSEEAKEEHKGWQRVEIGPLCVCVCVMEQILPKYVKPTIVTGTSGWLVKLFDTNSLPNSPVCRFAMVSQHFLTRHEDISGHHDSN